MNRFAILFLISRSSPITKVAIELLKHRSVLRFGFAPHITQLFQPLSLVLFGVIKGLLNTLEQSDEMNKRTGFAAKLHPAFEKATTSANIRSAFECADFVSKMENDESTGHLCAKNFMKSHNSIHFLMPTSPWIRFQLGYAAKHSVSFMLMNLLIFTQKFFEWNKKAIIFNILLIAFFVNDIFLFV